MGLTAEQLNEIEVKYRAYKAFYCHDLPVTDDTSVISDEGVVRIERCINLLRQVAKANNSAGLYTEASIISHLIGDLQTRLLINKRLKWNRLSQAEKNYQNMIVNHPEWRVRSNFILDMTGAIVDESQSTDVAVFQAAVIGAIIAMAMPTKPVRVPPTKPIPIISKIAAFAGTRDQFRAYVLKKLMSEPNNPLGFLLNKARTGWNVASSTHDVLIERYDIWQAGHIKSGKIGGVRLMIQTAWENQVQGQSVERPSIGGAVLDNPVVEVGGFPVAKTTVKTWELAGRLPPGTAEAAPIVVK